MAGFHDVAHLGNGNSRGRHVRLHFNFNASGVIASYLERSSTGKVERERIERNEKADLHNGMIVIEDYDDGMPEWDVLRDANGDGVWQKAVSGDTAGSLQSTLRQLADTNAPDFGFTFEAGREDTLFRYDASGQIFSSMDGWLA